MKFFAATHLPRLALAVALSFPALVSAQSNAEVRTQLKERAKSFFSGAEPGGVVLVRKGDQILLREGYGLADVENNVPMTADKVLPLASVTKQFTAFAVLQLVQSGKLKLDQPVGDVLSNLPPSLAKVSLRQLLHPHLGCEKHQQDRRIPCRASQRGHRRRTDRLLQGFATGI